MNKITVFSSCYGKHAFKQGISSLFTPLSLAHPGSLASSLPSPLTHNQKPPFVLTVTLFLLSSSLIPLALFSPAPVFLEPLSPSRLSCPSPPGLPWFVVPLSLCPPPSLSPPHFSLCWLLLLPPSSLWSALCLWWLLSCWFCISFCLLFRIQWLKKRERQGLCPCKAYGLMGKLIL